MFDADYEPFHAWDCPPEPMAYPTALIYGELAVSDSWGCGLLVVTGDLILRDVFFTCRGVILVGGSRVDSTDVIVVRGTLVTGLNEQLGVSPGPSLIGGTGAGQQTEATLVLYNSYQVQRSVAALVGFVPLRNTWLDNWANY